MSGISLFGATILNINAKSHSVRNRLKTGHSGVLWLERYKMLSLLQEASPELRVLLAVHVH